MTEEENYENCLFLDFIVRLPENDRTRLMQKPSCAFFIFRMIPPIAQHVVIQLIWKGNVPSDTAHLEGKDLSKWIALLLSIGIVHEDGSVENGDHKKYKINNSFKKSYSYAMMSGTSRISNIQLQTIEEKKKQKDVGKKASERWDCILRYLALPSEQNMVSVSETTRTLFQSAKFTSGNGERDIEITTTGFQFLLLSPVQQMWTYIIEYLKLSMKNGNDVVELLELLVQIILCATKGFEPGHEAFLLDANWGENQMNLINHLRELGVIFIRKRKDGIFFLTPLLSHLATNELCEDSSSEKTSNGSVIVETNFRLYAYTSSPLQLAILSTFTDMTYRFNDMSVGMLTRESVRRALQVGITAAQIISFLRTNTHPQCLASGGQLNCLPITVADQIRLWEDERKRMDLKDAYIYSTFEGDQEYEEVVKFAHEQGVLLWASNAQKLVIVSDKGHEMVRHWYQQRRKSGSGGSAA